MEVCACVCLLMCLQLQFGFSLSLWLQIYTALMECELTNTSIGSMKLLKLIEIGNCFTWTEVV